MSDDDAAVTMTDQYGDRIVVDTLGADVLIQFWRSPHDFFGMWFTPEKQEEFAQLYVAACHQAKVNAAQAVSG